MSDRGTTIVVVDHDSIKEGGLTAKFDADGWLIDESSPSSVIDGLETGVDAVVIADAPPAQDGVELFETIRATDSAVPVVLVGSEPSGERIEAALKSGITDYLPATESGEILRAKLRSYLAVPPLDGAVSTSQWSDIASSLSHDAKNPMNVVMGRLELLDIGGEQLDAIDRNVARVLTLLNELSTIGSCSRLIRERESVEIGAMARKVWAAMDTENATLQLDGDRTLSADRDLLEILFERVLENTIVHAGENVTVTVGASENGFYVEDDGPGIDAESRDAVFEQGYGTIRDGEGYGLFIVDRIVRSHGWSVSITSGNAGGCRIIVTTT